MSVNGILDMDAMKEKHRTEVREWKRKESAWKLQPASTRSANPPKKPREPAQLYACYCYKLHCSNMDTGNGCYLCEQEVEAGRDPRVRDASSDTSGHTRCTCHICTCQCMKQFRENERQQIEQGLLIEER